MFMTESPTPVSIPSSLTRVPSCLENPLPPDSSPSIKLRLCNHRVFSVLAVGGLVQNHIRVNILTLMKLMTPNSPYLQQF